MSHASVLRGAPFRASLYALALFALVLGATGALIHQRLAAAMYDELEEQVVAELVLFRSILDRGGSGALIETISDMERPVVAGSRLTALFDARGRRLAGHLGVTPDDVGWRTLNVSRRRGERATDFLARAERWSVGTIVVGRDARGVHRALAALTRSLALAGIAVGAACLTIGYVLSRRTRDRLDAMDVALERVARGDMTARLPIGGGDGQLDRVSRRMNGRLDDLAALIESTRNTGRAVAHDLRTPLARASLKLEEAARSISPESLARERVESASREIDSLGEICDTILRIGRIRSGDGRQTYEDVALGELVAETVETYEPLFEDAGQSLVAASAPPAGELVVRADRRMLRQALANLLANAMRHCPGGTRVSVAAARDPDGRTTLVVTDSGPGIPPSERDRVLEPFHRLDTSRSSEGSGLGLALVDAIARHHGAELRLEDAEPGLRVVVAFPDHPG